MPKVNAHIESLRKRLAKQAKAKKEYIEHFKKGGTIANFKPKYKHAAKPI